MRFVRLTRKLNVLLVLGSLVSCTIGTGAKPTTSGPTPRGSPTPTVVIGLAPLPPGWQRCRNTLLGYSIGYPGSWHPVSGLDGEGAVPEAACTGFDPSPISVEASHFGGRFALFDMIGSWRIAAFVNPSRYRLISRENVLVGTWAATRVETRQLLPGGGGPTAGQEGTLRYFYLINLGPERILLVETSSYAHRREYKANKATVDTAVATIRVR